MRHAPRGAPQAQAPRQAQLHGQGGEEGDHRRRRGVPRGGSTFPPRDWRRPGGRRRDRTPGPRTTRGPFGRDSNRGSGIHSVQSAVGRRAKAMTDAEWKDNLAWRDTYHIFHPPEGVGWTRDTWAAWSRRVRLW